MTMKEHLTFKYVAFDVFRKMTLRTKINFVAVWVILGLGVYTAVCAWHIAHATGGEFPALVFACFSMAFIGFAAQDWNASVMPPVFHYLWQQAAERGFADRYADVIELRYGESIAQTARTRGFANLVRGYCAAANG